MIGSKIGYKNGERHACCHQNGGEIYSVKLRHGTSFDPIGVDFLQLLKKNIVQALEELGKVMQETFLLLIFFGRSTNLPPVVGSLSMLSIKKSGLVLQNPVTIAEDKYNSLMCVSCNLISAVMVKRDFLTADHIWSVKGGWRGGKKIGVS